MQSFCSQIPNAICYPKMSPLEIFTLLGRFSYIISSSLHGAIFAYKHKVPFLLHDRQEDPKMSYFMKDRKLENYLFTDVSSLKKTFNSLEASHPDYDNLLAVDLAKLELKACLISALK